MSKNNESDELAKIIKYLEKISGDIKDCRKDFAGDLEGLGNVSSRLDAIDENSKEVLDRLNKINSNIEGKSQG